MVSIVTPFLRQKITKIKSVAKDGYNNLTFTTVYEDVPCRWQGTTRQLLSPTGEQVQARAECWLEVAYPIGIDYEFTFDGSTYKVINYSTKYDLFGTAEFIKVYLH